VVKGFLGDYSTQPCGDYDKPLSGSKSQKRRRVKNAPHVSGCHDGNAEPDATRLLTLRKLEKNIGCKKGRK